MARDVGDITDDSRHLGHFVGLLGLAPGIPLDLVFEFCQGFCSPRRIIRVDLVPDMVVCLVATAAEAQGFIDSANGC
eukprot:13310348-Alexandrium_andersonii.AAC.1